MAGDLPAQPPPAPARRPPTDRPGLDPPRLAAAPPPVHGGIPPSTSPAPASGRPAATGPRSPSTRPSHPRWEPHPGPPTTSQPGGGGSRTDGPSQPARHRPPGVTLPANSWVDLGLAAAITTAAALVWARRRRRYTPRPPTPALRLDDPRLTPLPPVVAQVRRGLRRLTGASHAEPGETGEPADLDGGSAGAGESAPAAAVPVTPGLDGPLAGLWPPAGLGLTGPGAEAAARGFLVATLAAGGVADPHARGQVVMPAGMLATLLGAAAVTVPGTPRLSVTAGLADALDLLERHVLHRTRMVYEHEADHVAAVRQADPTEQPLPPVILLAHAAADHERARITALLVQGERLDIHGVLLGGWPDGDTVIVAADGNTTPARADTARHSAHPADPADLRRLAVLTPGQAADLLATLAESHSGPPPPAQPAPGSTPLHRPEPGAGTHQPGTAEAVVGPAAGRPAARPGRPTGDAGHNDEKTTPTASGGVRTAVPGDRDDHAATSPPNSPTPDQPGGAEPGAAETDDRTDDGEQLGSPGDTTAPEEGKQGRARVFVLGRPRVDASGAAPGEPLRARSLELLVYLAVRDGAAASVEAILEDLLPDAPARKAPYRLHTYVPAGTR